VRPAWPKAYLLRGLMCEKRGNLDQAAAAYQEAIRLGERQTLAYERLISLLMQFDRLAEADHYLRLLPEQIAASETLSSLQITVAAQRGQMGRAVEAARRGAERRPQDPIAQLWLGQVLLNNGKHAEAEMALTKAVTLAPDDTRTLVGLFNFYARTNQPDRARETLQKTAALKNLPEADCATILAQGYELLGDPQQARANYRRAAQLAGDNVAAQLRLAEYLLRTGKSDDRSEPEQLLRAVLRRSPDSNAARRMLAELLVERGGEQSWQEALRLMAQAHEDRAQPGADRRMEALLLARRGGKDNLDKATQIFEELVVSPGKALAADCLWLARLYENNGKIASARQQYLKLVSRENPSAAHLACYVELLFRQDNYDEAAEWLTKLETLLPDDLGVATLRARWFRSTKQNAKIEPLVESLAEKLLKQTMENPQSEAELALRVGNLYSAVDQHPAAERWYRRLVSLEPQRYAPLASALTQQGRMQEAIELCQQAAQSDHSSRPAVTLATLLAARACTTEDLQRAEPTLAKAITEHKDDVGLLFALGGLRVAQQHLDEATGLFRQVVMLNPAHVGALNNLATLLAEQPGKQQESLECIDRAIQIVGPQPPLLDTKGMTLVFEKKADEAVPLLEAAAATSQADPRYHFHLAVAYDRAGESKKARAALQTARARDLARQVLTPWDRQMLAELEKKFDF
jgi:tetratricopeptide (TPR) repeat protein